MELISNGGLHVILGPMFASKSTELIKLYNRYNTIKIPIVIITPVIDNRYTTNNFITSHDKVIKECIKLDKLSSLDEEIYDKTKIILIDEGQFFEDLFEFCINAIDVDKKYVVVCGLNGDFERKPIGRINDLIPYANKIDFLTGFCSYCNNGTPGVYTLRITNSSEQVLIGDDTMYKTVCSKHYLKHHNCCDKEIIIKDLESLSDTSLLPKKDTIPNFFN